MAETADEKRLRIESEHYQRLADRCKAKTGRPKLNGVMEEALRAKGLWDAATQTRRTLQNRLHAQRAMQVLGGLQSVEFAWLMKGPQKKTILAELGRIESDEALLAIARAVCEQKGDTRATVAALRRMRLGSAPAADTAALARVIEAAIEDYVNAHPGITVEQIEDACVLAGAEWQEAGGDTAATVHQEPLDD
jgi:hypothetical protein